MSSILYIHVVFGGFETPNRVAVRGREGSKGALMNKQTFKYPCVCVCVCAPAPRQSSGQLWPGPRRFLTHTHILAMFAYFPVTNFHSYNASKREEEEGEERRGRT